MEKEILQFLESSNVNKSQLKKITSHVTSSISQNIMIEKFINFPPGIPNPFNFLYEFRLDKSAIGELEKLVSRRGVESVRIFPKGIINPDYLNVQVRIDARKF